MNNGKRGRTHVDTSLYFGGPTRTPARQMAFRRSGVRIPSGPLVSEINSDWEQNTNPTLPPSGWRRGGSGPGRLPSVVIAARLTRGSHGGPDRGLSVGGDVFELLDEPGEVGHVPHPGGRRAAAL